MVLNGDETGRRSFWLTALLGLTLACLSAFGPVGCNTAEGFGEDMEEAGEEIQEETEDADD